MGPRLAVIVSKCPRLKNVYKSNGRCLKKFKSNNKGNNRGEQQEVLSIHLTQDCVYSDGHNLRGHFSIGTIGPRESVLCSQRSSDVIRVQSLWECVKYRDKGKNNRGSSEGLVIDDVCERVRHRLWGTVGVLATIEQWYPTRKFNETMVPRKRNSKVWPGLVTKEKTMKYPASAMCTVL